MIDNSFYNIILRIAANFRSIVLHFVLFHFSILKLSNYSRKMYLFAKSKSNHRNQGQLNLYNPYNFHSINTHLAQTVIEMRLETLFLVSIDQKQKTYNKNQKLLHLAYRLLYVAELN